MQKRILLAILQIFAAACLFAYNPPTEGENLYRLSDPNILSGSFSSAGGALFSVTPSSITNNPALTALEQRTVLQVGYTALIDTENSNYGNAFDVGVLVPSRWCVATALMEGILVPFDNMQLGNIWTVKAGVSKDLTDKILIGMGTGLAVAYGYGNDWSGTLDFGALYQLGNLGKLRNTRIGISLLNVGKPFTEYTVTGTDSDSDSTWYPGLATIRGGIAATIFEQGKMKGGFSADATIPEFQNFIFDMGMQFSYADIIRLNTSWEMNTVELLAGHTAVLPSIGISFKFAITSSKLAENNADWGQSEISTSTAWQQLSDKIQAVSGGAVLSLGMKDTEAPEIQLWGGNN